MYQGAFRRPFNVAKYHMQKNPFVEYNQFKPNCFDLKVDHIRIGLTKESYNANRNIANKNIFKYIKDKDLFDIKNNKKYLVFDFSQEGIYQKHFNLFQCLDYNCKLHNISKKQVLYFTSNFFEKEEYGFKPIVYQPWIDFMQNNYIEKECNEAFECIVEHCIKNYKKNIYFSSFNKTWSRSSRDYFHFLLYKNSLLDKGFISNHDKQENLFGGMQLKDDQIEDFRNKLPLEFDYPYFWSAGKGFNADIYAFTTPQFHIVNESIVDTKKYCVYSEKPFKPIAFFQPFFVIGAKNYHKTFLSRMKIKDYTQLQKFTFDDNRDVFTQVKRTIPKLQKLILEMDKINRIDWRFREEATLKHNWLKLRNYNANVKLFKKLNKMLTK
jgi:hypothetical protein